MRKFFDFLKAVSKDERIPFQNRVVLGGLLLYLLAPIDIIPEFVPILGWLDDAFLTIVVLDYVFNSADTEVILEHYPWSRTHFDRMKTFAGRLSWMVPVRLKKILFREAKRLALHSAPAVQPQESR